MALKVRLQFAAGCTIAVQQVVQPVVRPVVQWAVRMSALDSLYNRLVETF